MARKSLKCPPTVEPDEFGCVRTFSGMFDHHHNHNHHGRTHRKLLSNKSHGSKSLPGHSRNQVRMLTFDEQLRSINIESKKKNANVNQSPKGETGSSNHTRKNEKVRNNTHEESFWKKIKSRYKNPNKKNENSNFMDRIVVLKPSHRAVECPVDVGCRCSSFHSYQNVLVNDTRKKIKKVKSFKGSDVGESSQIVKKSEKLSITKRREPEVFVEARKHLAERLRLVAQGVCEPSCSTSIRVSRTLERILLSSPIHKSMASDFAELMGTNELENMDNDQFRENPSPVSVLDSFFTSSPTSTIESVEHQHQPRRLDFDEHSQTSSPPHQKTRLRTFSDYREFISSYVNDIYQICQSKSNWDDFLATDCPMIQSSYDHQLIHDCVKELLVSLSSRVTFVSSKLQPFSLEKDVVNEVVDQVDWHNGQPVGPRTLDLLVRRDIAKCGQWVDVISDGNDIVFEVVDEMLQELIMDAVFDILC